MQTIVRRVYKPRGTAKQIRSMRNSEVLVSGPAGTGKSRGCLEKLHTMALLNPGMRGLIVRKTLASLGSSALVTWREHVIKEALEAGTVYFYGGSQEEPPQYRYENGSVIVIGGLDKASKVMSTEYDIIYVQEATECTLTDWESLSSRLRNGVVSFQQLLADCNPSTPQHFLYQRCMTGACVLLESRHWENPRLYDDDSNITEYGRAYIARLEALTGVRRLRLLDGKWVSAEGAIYEEWDPALHIIQEMPKGWETWTRWWAVDFGYKNPFVLQCWAEDPDGRLYLYREIYFSQRRVEEHAKTIAHIVMENPKQTVNARGDKEAWRGRWLEPQPRAVVADHDAEGRATLEHLLGLSTVAAIKTVTDGIEGVQGRLQVAADGRPRLFVLASCLVERDASLNDAGKPASTIEEFPGYAWKTGPDGKPLPKEGPLKENDHGMDTTRYIVAEVDTRGRPRVRWIRG